MNIDERGRRAATDLLERSSARGIPTIDELVEPARPSRRRPVLVGVAAAVLLLAALGVVATRVDDSVRTITSLPAPTGVQAKTWSPRGLGLTMTVPATWMEGGPRSGFGYSIGEGNYDGYVLADRARNVAGLDTGAVGSNRVASLQALGAINVESSAVEIGGRRAVELRYLLHVADGDRTAAVTEYDIVDGNWFFLVAVGELEPVDRSDVTTWVASTIQVRPLDADEVAFADPLVQPGAPLPVPAGIEPKPWAPAGMHATLQVPADWDELVSSAAGYDHAIQPRGGGPTVMTSLISSGEAERREEQLKDIRAVIESAVDTTVDGHRARAIRYWIAPRGYPLHVFLDVEYVIDVGDGEALIVTTSRREGGADSSALLRWIRSTIEVE